jgi:hypothetical protein
MKTSHCHSSWTWQSSTLWWHSQGYDCAHSCPIFFHSAGTENIFGSLPYVFLWSSLCNYIDVFASTRQGTVHITANWVSTAIRGSELQAQLFSFFPGLDPVRTFQLGVWALILVFNIFPGSYYAAHVGLTIVSNKAYSWNQLIFNWNCHFGCDLTKEDLPLE